MGFKMKCWEPKEGETNVTCGTCKKWDLENGKPKASCDVKEVYKNKEDQD